MYNFDKNQQILDEWRKIARSEGYEDIFEDGVYYKGDRYVIEAFNIYERSRGKEDVKWNNSTNRILFITKESNTADYPYDIRCVELTRNTDGTKSIGNCHFNRNLLRLSAGLSKINMNNFIPFTEIDNVEYLDKVWDEIAVARININKHGGSPSSNNKELQKILDDENYKDLLIRQIRLLNPIIIVRCDRRGIIKDFIIENLLPEAKKLNTWIYYDEKSKIWNIHSYHLSYTQYPYADVNEEELYSQMMDNLQKALNQIEN